MVPLSRLNVDHVLEHFTEYVNKHFKELIMECPEEGVELVKLYLRMQSELVAGGGRSSPVSNRFRKWLAEETPAGMSQVIISL